MFLRLRVVAFVCAYVRLCIYARTSSIALTTAILYYILYTVIILQPKKPQLAFATSIFENHVFIQLFAFDPKFHQKEVNK